MPQFNSCDVKHVVLGHGPKTDALDTNPITDVVRMDGFGQATFIGMFVTAGTNTGTGTFKVQACDDAAGTNPVDIEFRGKVCIAGDTFSAPAQVAAGGTLAIAANKAVQVLVATVRKEDLPSGKKWICGKLTESTNDPITGAIAILLDDPVVTAKVYPTQIA